MNLTDLLIESIKESTQSLLKVSTLKLNANLEEASLKELFSADIEKVSTNLNEDEQAEFDWEKVIEALEKDNAFDEVFASIKGILDSVEGLQEEAVIKSVDLIVKGITLAANNIAEGYDDKVEAATAELKQSIETEVRAQHEEQTKDWAEKKEAELKDNLEFDEEEIAALKKAGEFVLALEGAFTKSNLSFDETITEKVEALTAQVQTLQTENTEFKKKQGQRVKDDIFNTVTEGLTDFEKDKLKSISEGVVFITDEDYKEKITEMKKAFTSVKKEEDEDEDADKDKKSKSDKESKDESARQKLGEEVSRLLGAKK